MTLKYLLDENVAPLYQVQLRRQKPDLVIWVIGEPGTLPKSTLDPEILCWCEEHDFLLVTNNRKSMPVHLVEHINQGRHIPGIFILNDKLTIEQNIDELILIAEASFDGEYQDQIVHLPLP
ncbi:DUF5615 family PIN-like protein [Brasilonema sp. UFV-L1]|uniref:DUF5615 family PIN-like protein n=1 Tax=Brasilonema sp. UFV-L1 TaxID=2234130 RepID=UPI00145FD1C1|nr:DUF5615 family PIN-like protein [Brasilonema sp. UFV-L1]NMG08516.1 hypothetical protein [Brasilonema sp. UFV-L1]